MICETISRALYLSSVGTTNNGAFSELVALRQSPYALMDLSQ